MKKPGEIKLVQIWPPIGGSLTTKKRYPFELGMNIVNQLIDEKYTSLRSYEVIMERGEPMQVEIAISGWRGYTLATAIRDNLKP